MQLGKLVRHEDAHVQIGRPAVRHRGEPDLAKEVDAVRRLRDADELQVRAAEGREVGVGEILHGREILWFVF